MQEKICRYIRAGAYDWVSAQACGITPQTFYGWLRRGQKRADEPYRSFFVEVRTARAEARVLAEAEVRRDSPFNWLRYGPGRERPGEPGWTDSHDVNVSSDPIIDAKAKLERKLSAVVVAGAALPVSEEPDEG